ncbi:hypothetical protein JCM10908_003478 [Rhodotorula pacifica]|uniref:Set6p n=1 Tax=Rhodotorula pacifica TaxID=1495444 RepID=UPI00317D9B34
MATDWSQLKQNRSAKQQKPHSASSSSPPAPAATSDPQLTSSQPSHDTQPLKWTPADLPPSLAVQSIPGRGRGVVARERVKRGVTLLATTTLVSVLDAHNLPHRCSHCFRSVDDLEAPVVVSAPKLLQCSLCHIVQYCSASCQKSDWLIHKKECAALRNAVKRRKESGAKHLPDAPLRALGRLLWSAQSTSSGKEVWQQVESLESHRTRLSPEEQERFFQLSVSLSAYVGQDTLAQSCPDAAAVIDLCSRFVSNSFALTCPTDLSNIGVSISPLTALINHSCAPNAVVVFPSFPTTPSSSSSSKNMAVIALRDLEQGEEVLTSYVDLSLPRQERQKELEERYNFQCACEECTLSRRVDPREAMLCPAAAKSGCEGLIAIPEPDSKVAEVECSKCGTSAPYKDVHPAIGAAKSAYADAEKAQYTDPRLAMLHLSNIISSLTTSLRPTPSLAPSACPLYSALQLLLTLQLHAHQFDAALATASIALRGTHLLFPRGHPVLALLMTTHARLVTTPPVSDPARPEQEAQYWMATPQRVRDVQALVAALREVEVAFGDGSKGEGPQGRKGKGGEMAQMLRTLIRDQEEGIEMGRRMKASMAAQQQQ